MGHTWWKEQTRKAVRDPHYLHFLNSLFFKHICEGDIRDRHVSGITASSCWVAISLMLGQDFADKIQSWRDLPLKRNQWNNVRTLLIPKGCLVNTLQVVREWTRRCQL
jgi:hypothetical protein